MRPPAASQRRIRPASAYTPHPRAGRPSRQLPSERGPGPGLLLLLCSRTIWHLPAPAALLCVIRHQSALPPSNRASRAAPRVVAVSKRCLPPAIDLLPPVCVCVVIDPLRFQAPPPPPSLSGNSRRLNALSWWLSASARPVRGSCFEGRPSMWACDGDPQWPREVLTSDLVHYRLYKTIQ